MSFAVWAGNLLAGSCRRCCWGFTAALLQGVGLTVWALPFACGVVDVAALQERHVMETFDVIVGASWRY